MDLRDEGTGNRAVANWSAQLTVQVVHSFHELAATPFTGTVNGLCWDRCLPGDFSEIIACLGDHGEESLRVLEPAELLALPLGAAGKTALACMLADRSRLNELRLAPVLNCVYAYPHDDRPAPIATDVFSFHVDSAPCPVDTWLCTYHGPSSEGLGNHQAQRLIDIPELRAALRRAHGGLDDHQFTTFLSENSYDLHYRALPGAHPYAFGVGNLWRIATAYPGCPVPPCIHRAPPASPNDPPRLLLIS